MSSVPNPIADGKVYEILLTALTPYPGNPRRGDVTAIAESLKVNGQFRPIIVRKETREILGGNHTFQAAKRLGWETIKVTFVENITDVQAKKIVLADNRTTDLAAYHMPDLTSLLEDLSTSDTLEGTGFDEYYLTNLLASLGKQGNPTTETPTKRETEETLGEEIDVDAWTFNHTCPKCGFEYD